MEWFLYLYGILNKIINFVITPFLIFVFGGQRKILPKADDPILEICAVDLAEKIRNCEVIKVEEVKKTLNFGSTTMFFTFVNLG